MWLEMGSEERKQDSVVSEFGFMVGNGYGWNISLRTRWPSSKDQRLHLWLHLPAIARVHQRSVHVRHLHRDAQRQSTIAGSQTSTACEREFASGRPCATLTRSKVRGPPR
jgi:hypothetical protein